ncbi:hypothetical protein [Campylobacter pinnipediorum]|uniref:hypothetical protein n=1 Tax=Campylobacter pinnipediorum TaxID=1965231 RepID=UPI0009958558|nr:hypothetical protein [Campylobacter pinnipediorum]AQW82320.1 hypothetical protein CPIN17261_0276 [Campylobacter pinnipediorum subsp. pinnipediorum]
MCITQTSIIKEIVAVEYQNLDFFEDNLFDNTNIKITYPSINTNQQHLHCTSETNDMINNIIISNSSNVVINKTTRIGSTIDIKTSSKNNQVSMSDIINLLDKMHAENKELFFKIIKREYIDEKCHPEY